MKLGIAAVIAGQLAVTAAVTAPAKPQLHVKSIVAAERRVVVELVAVKKAPQANFFTFVDERGRRFVAQAARCTEPSVGLRSCELELPAGYERHKLVSLTVHLGSLKGRELKAPESELDPTLPVDGGVSD